MVVRPWIDSTCDLAESVGGVVRVVAAGPVHGKAMLRDVLCHDPVAGGVPSKHGFKHAALRRPLLQGARPVVFDVIFTPAINAFIIVKRTAKTTMKLGNQKVFG